MKQNISIFKVKERESKLKEHKYYDPAMYPLFESYNIDEDYNFTNIRESVESWNNYSNNTTSNMDKVLELFDLVAEKGNKEQLAEITDIINEDIIPYIPSPVAFRSSIINKKKYMHESYKQDCINSINDKILETVECDRVLKNYNIVSKRFNLDKIIANANNGYDINLMENVYNLCSLFDTYDMEFKPKFCVTLESILYGFSKYSKNLNESNLIESVVDYFLLTKGLPLENLVEEIESSIDKDKFLNEECKSYIRYLQDVNREENGKEDNAIESYQNHMQYLDYLKEDFTFSEDKYPYDFKYMKAINEFSIPFMKSLKPGQEMFKNFMKKVADTTARTFKNDKKSLSAYDWSGIFNFFTWCIIGVLCQAAFGLSFVTYVGGTIILYAALVIIEIISYQASGGGYTRDFLGNIDKILAKQISSVRLSIKDSTTKHTKAIKQNYLDSLVGLKKHITDPEFMGVDAVKPLKEIGYNAFKKGKVLKDDIKKVIKAILKKLSHLSFGEVILFIIEWTFKIFLFSIVIIPLVFLLGTLACFLLPFIATAIIVGAMIAFMAVIFAVLKDIITSIITGKPTNGERKKVNEYRKLIIDKFDELGRKLKANTKNCTFGSMESSFRTGFSEGFDEAWKVHKEDFELDYEE